MAVSNTCSPSSMSWAALPRQGGSAASDDISTSDGFTPRWTEVHEETPRWSDVVDDEEFGDYANAVAPEGNSAETAADTKSRRRRHRGNRSKRTAGISTVASCLNAPPTTNSQPSQACNSQDRAMVTLADLGLLVSMPVSTENKSREGQVPDFRAKGPNAGHDELVSQQWPVQIGHGCPDYTRPGLALPQTIPMMYSSVPSLNGHHAALRVPQCNLVSTMPVTYAGTSWHANNYWGEPLRPLLPDVDLTTQLRAVMPDVYED